MSFVAKWRAEKKEDKINTDGTIQDLQITNLFLSMCGQDAINNLSSLISPKERVVTADRAKFLSVIQDVGESDDDFLVRLSEEARYCDFEKLKNAANPEKGW